MRGNRKSEYVWSGRIGTPRLAALLLGGIILAGASPMVQAVPLIAATKTDALADDADSSSGATPGDTIEYTITITSFGNMDALNVLFADLIDNNSTLVPGSVKTTPIARNDSYDSLGNVGITVPDGAGDVLANDDDPDGGSVTVSKVQGSGANVGSATATNQSGTVTVASDGSFTYEPPPGFEGSDTFTYEIIDDEGQTDTARVDLTVSGMIWFIDSTAAAGGDGRLSSPFNCLVGAGCFDTAAADDAGDNIFVAAGSYTGGLTLLNNQKLIGDGSSSDLATITGISLPANSATLPTFSGVDPVLTNTGDTITVGQNNTIRGLSLSTSGGTGMKGSSVGTLTVSETSISGGGGIDINGGTLAVTLDSLSASSSTDEGIRLNSVSGAFAVTTGSISTTGISGVDITGNPSVDLSVTLTNVSSTGGTVPGIDLQNTTGSFEIIGDGTNTNVGGNGSGGTISGKTGSNGTNNGIGVLLNNATNVTLRRMQLNDFQNFAIKGTSVNGFELSFSTIDGSNGTSAGADEDCIHFNNLSGTALIDDSDISGGFEDNIRVINTTGTLNLSLTDSLIGTNGNDGALVETRSSATANLTITGNSFTASPGDLLQTNVLNSSAMDLLLQNNTFANVHPSILSGGGGVTISGGGGGSSVTFTYEIDNNSFSGAKGIALNVFKGTGAGSFEGEITGNDIGISGNSLSGSSQASGIKVSSNGTGTHATLVDNNTVLQTNETGIFLTGNDGSSTLNATVTNNSVGEPGSFSFAGIFIDCGALSSDTNLICADIGGTGNENSFVGSGGQFGLDFVSATSSNATTNMPGLVGGAAGVASYIQGRNTGTPSVDAFGNHTGSGTSCAAPPLMAAPRRKAVAIGDVPTKETLASSVILSGDRKGATSKRDTIADTLHNAHLLEDELPCIVEVAVQRWTDAGIGADDLARLEAIAVAIVEQPGLKLGSATATRLTLDIDGAGYGWFIDMTPEDDEEFARLSAATELIADPASSAYGRIDLLTVVLHEFGHVLGLHHGLDSGDLMADVLGPGVRRLPIINPDEIRSPMASTDPEHELIAAQVATAIGAATLASGETLELSLGTLNPGQIVVITFQVTIDSPLPGGAPQICNQGLVRGDNFTDVLTDDPDVGGAANPTCTPVQPPLGTGTIVINKVTSPAGGTGFNFNGDLGAFTLDDGQSQQFTGLAAGDYDVVENVPAGWGLDGVVCVGGDSTPIAGGVTVQLDTGENITCTFSNCDVPGDLDHDCDVDPTDFDLFLQAFATCQGDGDYNADANLDDSDNCITLVDYQLWFASYQDANSGGGTAPTTPPLEVLGDFDVDFDVDQSDFGSFQVCVSGPDVPVGDPACEKADLDNDGDVDQGDFGLFQRCLSGASVTLDLTCKYE